VSKKILILAETIDVDSSSAGRANLGMIHSLLATGCDIEVFHYSNKSIVIPQVKVHHIRTLKTDINFWLSRFQRVLQRLLKRNFSRFIENRRGFSFTFTNDVASMVKAIERNIETAHLIITLSKGASYRTHGALLKLPSVHEKWLAYIHDPYPFHWYPKPYDWVEAGSNFKEEFILEVAQKAKWIGYPSLKLQEWMAQYDSQFETKGVIIPHQTAPVKVKTALPVFFTMSKFNMLHAGNLMKQRPPFTLLEGFQLFLDRCPEAQKDSCLLLIGSASYHKAALEDYKKQMPNVVIKTRNLPFNAVYNMQQVANVNIILEAVAAKSPFLPGKFPHCLAASKPIFYIGPEDSETRRLLGKEYSYLATADNAEKISEIIEKLYLEWKSENQFDTTIYNNLNHYFSTAYIKDKIDKLIS
jgi:hypothetical protein